MPYFVIFYRELFQLSGLISSCLFDALKLFAYNLTTNTEAKCDQCRFKLPYETSLKQFPNTITVIENKSLQ